MANLKEIRIRISSVSSTMQITSAMKMVSAAKLKKAQDEITAMRPYSNKLSELMKSFSGSSEDKSFSENRKIKNVLVIAISSNRGLCGAFNANIFKEVKNLKSKEEFKNARGNNNKLNQLLYRLKNIKIFDPACGSGNFLIIAYKELRRLEMEIFKEMGSLAIFWI